ncbi:S-adenosyl-L-methionine-dependent methyltransferase [Xylaria palmicola]|nr:S-adenosyl-L-methionine-dependent methyltransferase [Xylaria palmicola]
MLIRRGTLVEVPQRSPDEYRWQFLHVADIYVNNQSQDVVLRGIRLARQRYMRGMLPKMKNEVCAIYDINKKDTRPEHIQAAVEVSARDVCQTRWLVQTNDVFPSHRFSRSQWKTVDEIENKAVLVQRWKFYKYWPSAEAMATKSSYSGAVIRLRSTDIKDTHYRVPNDQLRNQFRGGIVPGGSFKGGRSHIPTVDLHEPENSQDNSYMAALGHGQKYTADDMFCGAGGASSGIRNAGCQIRIACDKDEAAGKTYKANFPEALFKQMDIFDLAEMREIAKQYSDFLTGSPPCQYFSPAHTHPGKNDEVNAAALDAFGLILEKRRPRISTGEQTFGLLFDKNEEYFNSLIGQYTALGYSFSWGLLRFLEYGVPSFRRRLIWIASCPGEALPPFPKPTHSETDKRLPTPVTIRDMLSKIRPGSHCYDPLHDVRDMLSRAGGSAKFPRAPYDDKCQVGTVTTAGSEWAHPSGERHFTLRELAAIQGFSRDHKFLGTMTQIKRQIGNAFPPLVVEALYCHLRNWLLQQDAVVPRKGLQPGHSITASTKVIILDRAEKAAVAAKSHKPRDLIVVDTDDEGEDRYQSGEAGHDRYNIENPSKNVIHLDDDLEMAEAYAVAGDNYPSYSRESSRTLSAESLPSLIEMEMDGNSDDEVEGMAVRYLDKQREEARTYGRALRG